LQSRAVIDQAKGMIMRERGCDADQAFDVLRSLSQNRNVRLAEIAAELVAAGQSGEPYDLG
jgi:AmiR/NasT family two-component response regulator